MTPPFPLHTHARPRPVAICPLDSSHRHAAAHPPFLLRPPRGYALPLQAAEEAFNTKQKREERQELALKKKAEKLEAEKVLPGRPGSGSQIQSDQERDWGRNVLSYVCVYMHTHRRHAPT